MKNLNIKTHIDPKFSAQEWQLYSSVPGGAAAARALNKALKVAVNAKGSTPSSVMSSVRAVFRKWCERF